jgi:hypothetical protein
MVTTGRPASRAPARVPGGRRQAAEFQGGVEFQPVGAGGGSRLGVSRGGDGNFEQDARVHAG